MTDNGNNDAHYSNAEYDAIMTKVLSDSDAAGRMELMHQAEDLLVGEDQAIGPPVLLLSALHGGGRCPRHVLHPAGQLPVLPRYQGLNSSLIGTKGGAAWLRPFFFVCFDE